MIIQDISANVLGVTDVGELFGIEIEVENVTLPHDLSSTIWSVVEDGSLRNGGMEFVSSPSSLEDALRGVRKFYEWNSEFAYRSNARTSTHVHYNVLGFDHVELAASLTAYAIVEPLLFRLCGKEREENVYCVPWYRAPDQANIAQRISSGNLMEVNMSCKYSALYLEPINRFGTVEFRQAPVFDEEGLLDWVSIISALMTNSRSMGTPEEVIRLYEEGPQAFVIQLLGIGLASKLSRALGMSMVEDIVDEADSISVAEMIAYDESLSYTYKVTDWIAVESDTESQQQRGYHRYQQCRPIEDILEFQDYIDEVNNEDEEYR